MATHASFTTIDEAITHNLTLALLGLEYVKSVRLQSAIPRYIGLREVPGAQPPDAVLGVCARGDAACPGHRLPRDKAKQALTCCVECGALVGVKSDTLPGLLREAGAVLGTSTPDGRRCKCVCRGPAAPRPGDPSRPVFGVFDDIETAAADERVREALEISLSMKPRARWVGLRLDVQPDGSRRVVGVCHAHSTARGCPGHALTLRHLADAAACCGGCGAAVTTKPDAVRRAKANGSNLKLGGAVLDAGGQVTGWVCRACSRRAG